LVFALGSPGFIAPAVQAAEVAAGAKKPFDVAAGPAEKTLKQFSEQSGRGVIFVTTAVKDVQTNGVRGELAVAEAINQLVAGTPLVATLDGKTGSIAISRATPPPIPKETARAEPSPTTRAENQQANRGPTR
jgi:hypothetical protein